MAMSHRTKYWLKFLLSLGLGGFFLYLAINSLGGCPAGTECIDGLCRSANDACDVNACRNCVDWSTFPSLLSEVSLGGLALFSLGFLLVHCVRIWRWYYLLRPLGLKEFKPALKAGAIGLAAIVIIPLRLGELVRPYLISRDTKIGMSAALGTAVVERVVDGLLVTLMLFVTLAIVPSRGDAPGVVYTAGTISALVFSGVMGVLLFSWWQREGTIRVLRAIGNRVSTTLTEKLLGLLEGFLDGVAALRAGGDLYRFLGTTLLYWAVNGATLTYLANVFGLEITLWEGYAVTSLLVIGIMVPGGPGHIGTFEFFLQTGLALFIAVDTIPGQVLAFIATLHVLQFLIQVIFGAPFWLVDGLNLKKALASADTD